MEERERIIKNYFDTWMKNEPMNLPVLFDSDITYVECYGPVYHGIDQIIQWFINWNMKGKVTEWSIKQFIHQNNISVVEWFFQCNYENCTDGFDGVSIITFNDENKMTSVKEFQSKAEHYFPY